MEFCGEASRSLPPVLQKMLQDLKTTMITMLRTQSLLSKLTINLLLVLVYGYLLATSSEWSGDHAEIGCIHVLTLLPTLRFLFSLYAKTFLEFLLSLLSTFGWVRLLLYSLFLLIFSYVFVAVLLDKSALMCMNKAKELFLSKFENNFMKVEEGREYFERDVLHPLYHGNKSPVVIHQLIRYPMEDAQMNCTTYIKGFRGGKPFIDQVEWRRNGVPLKTMSDRYSVVTEFRELGNDHPVVDESMKAMRLTCYELKSTLTIYLLDEADFGSYTCHTLDDIQISVDEWKSKTGQKSYPNNNKKTNTKKKSENKQPVCQCTFLPEQKYVFQDVHTQKQEFRLIKMKDRHDQIEAPVTSILFFSTNYLHLSSTDDVRSDYTVNDVSFQGLCSDETRFAVRGCSSLQRLLAFFMSDNNELWWFLYHLPFSSTEYDIIGAHRTSGHCLCENSFGRHNMKYTRRYYNRTSGRYEMFEATHPRTLFVRPPKMSSSSFFANIWNHGSMKLLSFDDYLPEYTYKLALLRDLAVASAIILDFTDAFFIGLGLIVFIIVSKMTLGLFRFVGQVSKKCFLKGSMGYLVTAKLTTRDLLNNRANEAESTENQKFDIFFSLSDSQIDRQIAFERVRLLLERQLGLTVCLRQRDLPPNEPELNGLTQAIENSGRFIIFLSKDFLQDACRQLETSMIIETLWDRVSELNVLVIKLDDSKVPAHWANFTVHDWTSGNLSVEDHQLRLVRWLASPTQQNKGLRSALDALVTVLPFLLLIVFFLILTPF